MKEQELTRKDGPHWKGFGQVLKERTVFFPKGAVGSVKSPPQVGNEKSPLIRGGRMEHEDHQVEKRDILLSGTSFGKDSSLS